jgi:hypothetical protein
VAALVSAFAAAVSRGGAQAAVNSAPTGKETVDALKDLHRVAYADLPLIPLWQTVPPFAWLETLEGPAEDVIDLYQQVDQWRVVAKGGKR